MALERRVFRNELKSRKRLVVNDIDAVYHVMSRTACQAFLFGDEEKEVFTAMMRQQARFAGIEILTFCIMNNHFHLLLRIPANTNISDDTLLARYTDYYGESKTPQSTFSVNELKAALKENGPDAEYARKRIHDRMGNLSAFMRELKQRFSIWYNSKHGNHGTIWAARFKSLLVENTPEALTKVAAYIDLNPIRAGIVDDPKDYRWCGYAESIAGIKIAQSGIQSLFNGMRNFKESVLSYRLILFGKGYSTKGNETKDRGRISEEKLNHIIKNGAALPINEMLRARIRYFSDGMALGSRDFIETLFQKNRQLFGQNRNQGGRKLKGENWSDLHIMRDLKKRVYT